MISDNNKFVFLKVPVKWTEIYNKLLILMSNRGIDMIKDCNASCDGETKKLIECWNQFNAACAAYAIGQETEAKILIRILIDNAFKYTEEGDFITIKSSEKGRDRIQIIVSDTGIGISEKDQKHIFERFFRSSSVRATEIEGSGIGLSIAAIITNTLGGHIKVKSTLGEGTSFIIDLARGREVKKKKSNKKKM